MSNKTRKWRSAIAMVLVISMLFSIFPVAAFAQDEQTTEPIKYVSLGDSMTNGYGLDGYEEPNDDGSITNWFGFQQNDVEGSYPWKVADHFGWKLSQIATSGLRADDVYYLLNLGTDYAVNWDDYGRQYMAEKFEQSYKDAHNGASGTKEDIIAWAAKIYQEEVKNADVISIGIGSNNFATLMDMRMMWWMGRILGDESMFSNGGYQGAFDFNELVSDMTDEQKAQLAEVYTDIYAEIEAILMDSAAEVGLSLDAPLATDGATLGDLVEDMTNAVAYTSAGFALGYKGTIDTIMRENNDAEIIIVGLTNWFRGMVYGIPVGEEMFEFPMGDLMEIVCDFAGVYMAALPAAYDVAAQINGTVMQPIYFADTNAAGVEDVELIVDVIVDNTADVDLASLEAFELGSNERFQAAKAIAQGITSDALPHGTTRARLLEAMGGYVLDAMGMVIPTMEEVEACEAKVVDYYDLSTDEQAVCDGIAESSGIPSGLFVYLIQNNVAKIDSCVAYLGLEKSMISSLHLDVVNVKHFEILSSLDSLKNVTWGAIEPHMQSPNDIGGALIAVPELGTVSNLMFNFLVGSGVIVHPSDGGHTTIANVIIDAYDNNHTVQDETIENLKVALNAAQDIIVEYYDDAYAYAYQYAKDAKYIDAATSGIEDVIVALDAINLDGAGLTGELKAEVEAEIAAIKATLETAKALINEADVLDDATFNALMDTLNAAGVALEQLVDVLEQAGVDVNNLVIIPALNAAYDKLTNEVLPEIDAALQEAIAVGTDWLMDKALDAIDAVIEALPEMAQFAHDYIYDYLYNNPEEVIAFFNEYGDEIIEVVGEYGPYALAAMGYIVENYGQDILNFVMENDEEILEVTAMLLKEHGPHAVQLIQVYAEELGYCQAVRELIADLEDQIADLKAQLEDELKAQLEDLKAELEDLYAQLENASDDVKEQIQNAIEEVEKLIDEVEQKIAEIEAAIAELEAQLEAAQKALEEAIDAVEAVVEAIKDAIEAGVETVEEILAVIEDIVKVAEDTIAGVKTAIEGIQNAVEDIVEFVDELIANGIVAAEMIAEIIDTVMDIIDGVKAGLEQGDIDAAIEAIRNELTNGYEELSAMLAAIDTAIAEELDAIVGDLEAALAQAQDEFEEALYNATHGKLACDAKTIAVYGGETVATEDGYAAIVAEEWGLTQTEAVDMADVILYQADPQIFVTALLDSVSGDYAANWAKYIGDEAVLAYLEQAKAELKDVLADEYGEEAAAVAEPLVDSFLFAVVEYAVANIETIEYLSRINEDALIVAAGMYNPVQGLSVTYGGETIDIEAMCQYLIEVTDVYNLLYAIAAQNAVFVDVSEAEAAAFDNVDVDSLLARAMALKAEAVVLLKDAAKALEENDMAKANALMARAEALYAQVDEIVEDVMPLVESLDSSYATEAGHAYIAEQILAAIEKADHECEWAIDDNEHCYYCENCGEEFVCGPHGFDGEEDTVCDVCGYERIIIDPTPEITTSSIVVYYLNENNVAIKDTTVREITTTGSYKFNIPDPIVFNGVEYLFNSLIDKDASDSYEAELEEGRFFVDVDVMPTTSSVLEFVLKYISEATVASIEISSTDHKTNYYVGDALDVTNLKLLVTYTNSQFNYVNVTPAMISGFDTTTAGEKTVTITYEGATTQYTIKVSDPGGQGGPICVDSVAISPASVSLEVGNTEALTANITPANAQIASVVWTSDNDAVATVDQNGVVTAVAKGNATITVTVTDVDDCVETATCVVTVTKTSSGGSFGGGGGGAYIKAKPEVIVPDNAVADGVTVTVDYIDYLTVNEVKDLVAKDDNLEVIGGRDSGALVAVKPANAVASFAHPVQLTVPVSKSALQNVDDVNKLTLALVTTDAQGNIQLTYVGGNYDASKGTFTAYVNQPGKYVLMEKLDIVKLELTIDRYVVFVNGEPIINDVPSRIVNNRTIVPAARVLHHLGCTVEWIHDIRTVAVTLPDGSVLNMPVDEPIPGFGAAPMIENGRTLVPVAYIADMMDAHVQWVGNDRKVIIVK